MTDDPEDDYDNPDAPPEPKPLSKSRRSTPHVGYAFAHKKIASRTPEEQTWESKARICLISKRISIRNALIEVGVPEERLDDMTRWMRTRTASGRTARAAQRVARVAWEDLYEKAKGVFDETMDFKDPESPARQATLRLAGAKETMASLSKADPKTFAEKALREDVAESRADLVRQILDGDDVPEPTLIESSEDDEDSDGE